MLYYFYYRMSCLYFKTTIYLNFIKTQKKYENYYNFNSFQNNNNLLKLNNVSKKKYINYYFRINKNYYHNFNSLNKLYYNNFINIVDNLFINNKKVLFIDTDYKIILPLINKIYGLATINSERFFFFLKKSFITLPNWIYLYKTFLIKYNIVFMVFLNFYEFKNFFNIFFRLNVPILSILPLNFKTSYLDYFFFFSEKIIEINKIFIWNFICTSFFKNFNLNYKKKNELFLKNFIKFKYLENKYKI